MKIVKKEKDITDDEIIEFNNVKYRKRYVGEGSGCEGCCFISNQHCCNENKLREFMCYILNKNNVHSFIFEII